jgi:hypothetical protein
MRTKEVGEDGECQVIVSDHGDRVLFAFRFFRNLFFGLFPFLPSKA